MSAAAKTSGSQHVLAVAGATGNLGPDIISVILKEYPSVFTRVLALVRDPSSKSAQSLGAHGTELHKVSQESALSDFLRALDGVDVLVDALPPGPAPYKDALVEAAAKKGVKVFFASEFGVDRRSDYWGWAHPGWVAKSASNARAREIAKGTQLKIVELYTGLFLKVCFSPFVGFDHANSVYTVYGPASQRVTFTAEEDIGRAIAELSLLALNPATASSVPEYIRISGSTQSIENAAKIVANARGDGTVIHVKSEDLDALKQAQRKELQGGNPDFGAFLRLAMAEKELNLEDDNQNELVNPRQSVFKWTTVEEYAKANKL